MVTIPLDIGIIVTSSGTIVTILLFVLKSYGSRTTNSVKQTEIVKSHVELISTIRKELTELGREIEKVRNDVTNNRGRIDGLYETVMSLLKSSEKVNAHDSDLVGIKRDIAYLHTANRDEKRNINDMQMRLENVRDTIYNHRNATRWTQRDGGEETVVRQRKRDDSNETDEG